MPDNTQDTVTVVDEHGNATDIPVSQVAAYRSRRFHVESGEERANRLGTAARTEAEGIAAPAILGGLRTVTLGGSDALMRALGGEDARIRLSQMAEDRPGATLAGELVGAILPVGGGALAARAGARVGALGEGAGALGRIASGAVEGGTAGAVFGAGNAVSELAMSQDPLTAEHIASALSSNVLLGGGVGGIAGGAFKGIEVGLTKASAALKEATAARTALESMPNDLRALDDAGLKAARKTAEAAHAADITAEKQSLEAIRVEQRAEMANQVKDLHQELATERPIFSALSHGEDLEPALKGIEGVSDARVQMAKSYSSLRTAFDNPLNIERNPWKLIPALEQRQNALEALQSKMPELQAALAGDSRAGVLEHIDAALEQTKQQIGAIQSLDSKANPVMSGRLAKLTAGPSERMAAIDAAREALGKAPELGIIAKGVKGAAFAGATALAHAIPGVGLAAPFVGKYASDAVGKLFERLAGGVGKVEGKAAAAAQKFLGSAKALEPYAAPTATKVLSAVRFGASKSEVPEDDLVALHRQRAAELFQQTMRLPDGSTVMRPEARVAMAAQLDGIRHANPVLADKVESVKARALAYLASVAPKKPEAPALQIGPDTSRPSDMAIRQWARAVRAVEDPSSVEERLARGICTPEEANCYRTVYPERFAALQREIFEEAPQLDTTLPMKKKVALSIFTGVPVTPAMQPNVISVLQSTFDVEPGSAGGTQAPRPQPNFGAMGSLKDIDKPTPAQRREQL